jgi:nitrogenase molybdenum-iron protein alpha/beta subunit
LQAISAWLGKPASLAAEQTAGETVQRIRTFSQATPDDLLAALDLLAGVAGAGIVVHGPRGCAAALAASAGPWAVTGLDQRDTIMGSEGAVSRAVVSLHRRHRPWVIFVVATPVVAINSDDPRAAADELTAELGIPVLAVRTDGFRSRVAATGYDTACQALLTLVPVTQDREDMVNLLAGDADTAAEAAALLTELGVTVNVLPAGADAAGFARAGRARLSICLDPGVTGALGSGLEASHGVALLPGGLPIGLAATQRWLAAVAAATGHPEPSNIGASDLGHTLGQTLAGRRVHLALPPDAGFAAAVLVTELGGTVSGLTLDHIDRTHTEALAAFARTAPDAVLHVAAGQPFETANLLASARPDLFVGAPEAAALAATAGVPSVGVTPGALTGRRGAEHLARRASKALANPGFVCRLAAAPLPYAAGWLRRSADWHIKQEVR